MKTKQKLAHSFAALGLVLNLSLARLVQAADGDLDTTFSFDGKVTTDFGGNAFTIAIAIDANGKIVAAGRSHTAVTGNDFGLARYNVDGSLDSGFGIGGKVTTDFGGNSDGATAIAIDTNGKIVAAGFSADGNIWNFALARYNADGSLDSAFGTGGKVVTDFGGNNDRATAIAIDANGKIVVAGIASSANGNGFSFGLARYNEDGSLDNSFGTGGKVTTDFAGFFAEANAIAIDGNGKIVVAGESNGDFALARYNGDGSLDSSFGTGGKVTTDFGGNSDGATAIAIDANGKIVVAGHSRQPTGFSRFALARYSGDGGLDSSFGTAGKVTADFAEGGGTIFALRLDSNGKIVVAGESNGDFALARNNGDGGWDSSFGTDGKVTTDFAGGGDAAHALAIDGNGNIVVAGIAASANGYSYGLARYLSSAVPPPAPAISYDAARDGVVAPAGAAFGRSFSSGAPIFLSIKTVNGFTGLGVSGGPAGEEIDPNESLTVRFANPQIVTKLTIAFLFDGPEFNDLNEQARIKGVGIDFSSLDSVVTAESDTTATYTIGLTGAGPVVNLSPAIDPGGAGVWEIRNPFGGVAVRSFTLAGSIRSVEDPNSGMVIDYYSDFSLHSFETVRTGPESRICLPRPVNYFTDEKPTSVAVGDLNGDGKADLAVVHEVGAVSVLFGNGDGTFQEPINLVEDFPAFLVALGDINGDHHLDVVAAGLNSPVVLVFPGNGNGTFGGPQVTAVEPGVFGMALGDVNRDGHLDLVTTQRLFDVVSLLYGDGSGRFSLPRNFSFPGDPVSPVLRDLNRDGTLDLVFARSGSDVLSAFFGGQGSFQSVDNYSVADIGTPTSVAVGDLDGDGRLDLAVGLGVVGGGGVLIMLANADGTFRRNGSYGVGDTFSFPIGTGDIDGDGRLDVIVANNSQSWVSVLVGRGDGTFEPPVNAFIGFTSFTTPQSVAVADFNSDGKQDIVRANTPFPGGISILLATTCNQTPVARCKRVVASAGPGCVAIASVDDGSGDPDAGDSISVAQSPPGPYPLGDTIVTLTVTDSHGARDSCNSIVTVLDTTPPSLSCPAVVSVDAVSPEGAAVNYTVNASDNCGPVTPLCIPASGSFFPVGTNAVECTASDGAGLESRCKFIVQVKGPSEQIADLTAQISALPISSSMKTRMLTLLRTADQLLASGDTKAACGTLRGLNDLIVALQQGRRISASDATALLAELRLIRAATGCPL